MTVLESAYITKPHTHVYQFSVRLGPNPSTLEYWGSLLLWSISIHLQKLRGAKTQRTIIWKIPTVKTWKHILMMIKLFLKAWRYLFPCCRDSSVVETESAVKQLVLIWGWGVENWTHIHVHYNANISQRLLWEICFSHNNLFMRFLKGWSESWLKF